MASGRDRRRAARGRHGYVSAADPVPETTTMQGEELGADDAWRAARRCDATFWTDSLRRLRLGDGFSHARALGFQIALTFIPLVIASVGLSGTLATERAGQVLRLTLVDLAPGASGAVLAEALGTPLAGDDDRSEVALSLGLLAALVALTTAMGQIERGANRIYGIDHDRPTLAKYGRALLMALGAGLPAAAGFGALLGAVQLGDAVERVYGLDDDVVTTVAVPLGVLLLLLAITTLLRHAPRRRQPGWSWLLLGAVLALVLWLAFTGLLVGYVAVSGSFGAVYGPLTGVIALLLWAQLTAVALFSGLAVAAQLEAGRYRRQQREDDDGFQRA